MVRNPVGPIDERELVLLCKKVYRFRMPRLFEWQGYVFFFFSNEGDPLEPAHVHIRKGSSVAKFWVDPDVSLANSWGFRSNELTRLDKVVRERQSTIRRKWNEYFSS